MDIRTRRRRWQEEEEHAAHVAAGGSMSDIHITPFIDVLLVLLIIFMVVTPLAQKGLDISLPQPPPPNQPKDNTPRNQVVLSLEEGAITINKNPVGLPELGQRLRDIFQARSDRFFRHHHVYGEVFSDISEKLDEIERTQPFDIIRKNNRIFAVIDQKLA